MNASQTDEDRIIKLMKQHLAARTQAQQTSSRSRIRLILSNGSLLSDWQTFARDFVRPGQRQMFFKKLKNLLKIKATIDPLPIVLAYDDISPKNIQLNLIENIDPSTQLEETTKKIQQNLINCKNIQEYLQKQIYRILSILQRRYSLVQYYNILNSQSKKITNSLCQLLSTMTLMDFIIILKKFTFPSDIITLLLLKQEAPFPILYKTNEKVENNFHYLFGMLGLKNYPLIINIWTQEAADNHKLMMNTLTQQKKPYQIYFPQKMQIDARYFEGSSFDSNINLFTITMKDNKKVLLADFIAYTTRDQKNQASKQVLINKLLKAASLIIFHIGSKEVDGNMDDFLIGYEDLLKPSQAKKIFYGQNLNNSSFIVQEFIQTILKNKNISSTVEPVVVNSILENKPKAFDLFYFQSNDKSDSKQLQLFSSFLDMNGFYLPPSYKKPETKQLATTIIPFTKTVSFDQFFIEKQSNPQYLAYTETRKTIKQFIKFNLNQPNYKEILLPKINSLRKLFEVEDELRKLNIFDYQETKNNELQTGTFDKKKQTILEEKQRQKKEIEQFLDIQSISPFIQNCRKYINPTNQIQLRYFIELMIQQKNTIITEKLQTIKALHNPSHLLAEVRAQYKRKRKELLQSTITVDSIIYQLSIYNEQTIDKKAQFQQSVAQYDINRYYSRCLDNLYPFNVINKEVPTFGNDGLQRFFIDLHAKYRKEDIFVVSAFGTKSSGKSTLLNDLFRYNIRMIDDKFAKGVYMGICQLDNKIVVVLDATGILDVTFGKDRNISQLGLQTQQLAQQATFDHEVASILMKESDVVLITGQIQQKQESDPSLISQRTKLAIGICFKVLEAIHINNQNKSIVIPKTVIFGFINKEKIAPSQEQILDQLLKDLTPLFEISIDTKPRLVLQKYIHLPTKNIISIPNINQGQRQSISNGMYGQKMIQITKNIVMRFDELLKYSMQQRTMKEFYGDSKVHWQIIKKTGNNIVRFQTIKQAIQKDQIYRAYKAKYASICSYIFSRLNLVQKTQSGTRFDTTEQQIQQLIYNERVKQYDSSQNKDITQNFTQSFKNSWFFFQQSVLKKFRSEQQLKKKDIIRQSQKIFTDEANQYSKIQNWINQFFPKINRLYLSILNRKIKMRFQSYDTLFQKALRQFYYKNINDIISQIKIDKLITALDTQNEFLRKTNDFLRKVLDGYVDKTQIRLNLINNFQTLLQTQSILLKQLQIRHINDCLSLSQQFHNDNYIYQLNKFINFQNQEEVPLKIQKEISDLIGNAIRKFVQDRKNDFAQNPLPTSIDIFLNFSNFKKTIDKMTEQLQKDIEEKSRSIYLQTALLKQKKDSLKQKIIQVANLFKDSQSLQDVEFMNLSRYYQCLQKKLQNYPNEQISLGKINIKILLIGKLFEATQKVIIDSQLQQIRKEKLSFEKQVKIMQDLIKPSIETRLKTLLDDDIKQSMKVYKVKLVQIYKDLILQINKKRVDNYINEIYIKLQQQTFSQMQLTINNPEIDTSTDKVGLQKLYKACFKFLSNPSLDLFQKIKTYLTQQAFIKNSEIKASEQLTAKINQFVLKITNNFITFGVGQIQFDKLKPLYLIKNIVQPAVIVKKIIDQFSNVKLIVQQIVESVEKDIQFRNGAMKNLKEYIRINGYKLIGCQSCCPLCGSKCILQSNHPDGHKAIHTILAFGGCRDQDNKFILQGCLYKKKGLLTRWVYDNKYYDDCFRMIDSQFQNWRQDLPKRNTVLEKQSYNLTTLKSLKATDISTIQEIRYIKIWANIEDLMISVYRTCFKTEQPLPNKDLGVLRNHSLVQFYDSLDSQNLTDYWSKTIEKTEVDKVPWKTPGEVVKPEGGQEVKPEGGQEVKPEGGEAKPN